MTLALARAGERPIRIRKLPYWLGVWLDLWDGPNVGPEIVIWLRVSPLVLEVGT